MALKPDRHTDELTPYDVTGADDDDDDDEDDGVADWFWCVLQFAEVFNLDGLLMTALLIDDCSALSL